MELMSTKVMHKTAQNTYYNHVGVAVRAIPSKTAIILKHILITREDLIRRL